MTGSATYWQKRLGIDAVPVYSPTMKRDAYITPREKALLDLLRVGRIASLRALRPLTLYRSVSGLWRAVQTLDRLGLLQRMIRSGVHWLKARLTSAPAAAVRTVERVQRTDSENVVTTVRTAPTSMRDLLALMPFLDRSA
jgi:hypothetical protein